MDNRGFSIKIDSDHTYWSPPDESVRKVAPSAVTVYKPGVEAKLRYVKKDRAAVEGLFEREAARMGILLDVLTQKPLRGRPNAEERKRRIALARVVVVARDADAELETIADIVGCDKSTILRLERAGRINATQTAPSM